MLISVQKFSNGQWSVIKSTNPLSRYVIIDDFAQIKIQKINNDLDILIQCRMPIRNAVCKKFTLLVYYNNDLKQTLSLTIYFTGCITSRFLLAAWNTNDHCRPVLSLMSIILRKTFNKTLNMISVKFHIKIANNNNVILCKHLRLRLKQSTIFNMYVQLLLALVSQAFRAHFTPMLLRKHSGRTN